MRFLISTALTLFIAAAACSGEYSKNDAAEDITDDDAVSGDTGEDTRADVPDDRADTTDTTDTPLPDTADVTEEEPADPCANHCSNEILDCGETGVDCGGGGCPTCAHGAVELCSQCADPNVAVAAPDRVMVVWKDVSVGLFNIMFSCFDGSSWSEPAAVHETGEVSAYPRLAVDSDGNFHLAHSEGLGTGRKVMYSMQGSGDGCGGAWSELERLDIEDYTPLENYNSCWPNIDVDENGDPWVIWTEDDYYKIHVTHRSSGAWSDPIDVAPPDGDPPCNSAHPDIAAAGRAGYAAWQEGHFGTDYDRTILFTEWTGSGWTGPMVIKDRDYPVWTQIQADRDGNVYVQVTAKNAPLQPVRCKARIGGEWTGWVDVSDGQSDYTWSSIRLHAATGLHSVWAQDEEGVDQVYYNTGDASTNTWNVPVGISSGTDHAVMPVVDVDNEGYAHIVWTEMKEETGEDGAGDIYYRKVRYEDLAE